MFSVLILGSFKCDGTENLPEMCWMDPEYETRQSRIFSGWFYDRRIDSCLYLTFGASKLENENVNRFDTKKECSRICRPHFPSFCFDAPPVTNEGESTLMWFYDSTKGKCVSFQGSREARENTNVFGDEAMCNTTCRDPDIGDCAERPPSQCRETDTVWYRYNIRNETCYLDNYRRCGGKNAFYTSDECFKHCGRFAQDKCKHRPLNISDWCNTYGDRYYYNEQENKCKQFNGCDDQGIGFRRSRECEQECLSANKNRRSSRG
uniref:Putative tick kunitz 99 n=1 Tax=Ixodes ricinus TaxID=34613 RepID=V5HNB2_IXORI